MTKKIKAMVRDDVRRIRARFTAAQNVGYSVPEATEYANDSKAVLVPKVIETPVVDNSGPTKLRDAVPQLVKGNKTVSTSRAVSEEDLPAQIMGGVPEIAEGLKTPEASKPQVQVNTQAAAQPVKAGIEIPQDWQDLPFPKLKKLAESLSGIEVRSRQQANDVIEKAGG